MKNIRVEKPKKDQQVSVKLLEPPKGFPNLPVSEEFARKLRAVIVLEKLPSHNFIVRK